MPRHQAVTFHAWYQSISIMRLTDPWVFTFHRCVALAHARLNDGAEFNRMARLTEMRDSLNVYSKIHFFHYIRLDVTHANRTVG